MILGVINKLLGLSALQKLYSLIKIFDIVIIAISFYKPSCLIGR